MLRPNSTPLPAPPPQPSAVSLQSVEGVPFSPHSCSKMFQGDSNPLQLLSSPKRQEKPKKTYELFLPPLLLYFSPEATAACFDEKGKGGTWRKEKQQKR